MDRTKKIRTKITFAIANATITKTVNESNNENIIAAVLNFLTMQAPLVEDLHHQNQLMKASAGSMVNS